VTDSFQLDLFLPARKSDPSTSHAAAASAGLRTTSQKAQLLLAYAKHPMLGLTDEEAGIETGLRRPGVCWWKRCSELRQMGLIRATEDMRQSQMGEMQQVCVITGDGLKVAESLDVERKAV